MARFVPEHGTWNCFPTFSFLQHCSNSSISLQVVRLAAHFIRYAAVCLQVLVFSC